MYIVELNEYISGDTIGACSQVDLSRCSLYTYLVGPDMQSYSEFLCGV